MFTNPLNPYKENLKYKLQCVYFFMFSLNHLNVFEHIEKYITQIKF